MDASRHVPVHLRVAHALVELAHRGDPESTNAYLTYHLSDHIATADLWDNLAEAPEVLDLLSPQSVRTSVMGALFGRKQIPPPVAAVCMAVHLLEPLRIEERAVTRQVFTVRLSGGKLGARSNEATNRLQLQWAQLRPTTLHITLTGHTGPVNALIALRDNEGRPILASAADDGTIRLWNISTATAATKPLTGHLDRVNCLTTIHFRGRFAIASGGTDGTIRIWDSTTGEMIAEPIRIHSGAVSVLAASQGRRNTDELISGESLRTLRSWHLKKWQEVTHERRENSSGGPISSDSKFSAIKPDGTTELLPAIGEPPPFYQTRQIVALPDEWRSDFTATYAVGTSSGEISLFSVRASSALYRFETGEQLHAMNTYNQRIVTAGPSGEVRFWRPTHRIHTDNNGDRIRRPIVESAGKISAHAGKINAIVSVRGAHGNYSLLATSGDDHTVRVFDPSVLRIHRQSAGASLVGMSTLDLAGRGRMLAAAFDDQTIRIIDPHCGDTVGRPIVGHSGSLSAIHGLDHSPGEALLIVGSSDGTIRAWQPTTCNPASPLMQGHSMPVTAIVRTITQGRVSFASGGADDAIQLWDFAGRTPVGRLVGRHAKPIVALASASYDADFDLLASACSGGSIRLWDLKDTSGESSRVIGHHEGAITALQVVVCRDGTRKLASASTDNTIRLWSFSPGAPAPTTLTGHKGAVTTLKAVRLRNLRSYLISGSSDGTIRVWNTDTAQQTLAFGLGYAAHSLAYVGGLLVIGGEAGITAVRVRRKT